MRTSIKFGLSLVVALVALSVTAPSARAQSFDLRIGSSHGGHHSNHGGYNHGNHGGYRGGYNGGYRGGYDRHRGGISFDIRIGGGRDYCPPPVYRVPDCDRDYYRAPVVVRPSCIQVIDIEYVTVYDRYGYPCGRERRERTVTAYWNARLCAYTYIDRSGCERIVNR
jgi:hypothetical protein